MADPVDLNEVREYSDRHGYRPPPEVTAALLDAYRITREALYDLAYRTDYQASTQANAALLAADALVTPEVTDG